MSLTCVLFEITFEILHKELFFVCVWGWVFFGFDRVCFLNHCLLLRVLLNL